MHFLSLLKYIHTRSLYVCTIMHSHTYFFGKCRIYMGQQFIAVDLLTEIK